MGASAPRGLLAPRRGARARSARGSRAEGKHHAQRRRFNTKNFSVRRAWGSSGPPGSVCNAIFTISYGYLFQRSKRLSCRPNVNGFSLVDLVREVAVDEPEVAMDRYDLGVQDAEGGTETSEA